MRSRLTPLLAALVLGACSSASRWSGTPGSAVVVYEPARAADAKTAKSVLLSMGWAASAVPAGVARRTRSSLAVYGQRHRAGRGMDLGDALRPAVGELDVLPFYGDGPGFQDAVLWLADARPEAATAPAPAPAPDAP
jgi:hypothetical protein